MKYRIIALEMHNAFMNMAIDETISESVAKKEQMPTIRFYRWLPSAVSIGYFQSMEDIVDVWKCRDLGINIVRRMTGGGAVYHSNSGEIAYSVIGPASMFPKDIIESYKEISSWVIKGLALLNIKAEFSPINDITVNGKKISGNALTRRSNVLLQQGTILYSVDVERMFSILKVPKEKIKDKLIKSAKERVTSIKDIDGSISSEKAYNALLTGFCHGKEYEFGELSEKEIKRAEYLAKTKYRTAKWNFMK